MYLSIIIPNYNGSQFIKALSEALDNQTLDNDRYEVIVVDNGSTDNSLAEFEQWGKDRANFRIFTYTEKQSSYAARNHGVTQSKGDVLVFTDTDCVPEPDWLEFIYKQAKNMEGIFLIVGDIVLFPSGKDFNCCEWYDKCAWLNQKSYAKHKTGATANLAVSRLGYERVGGFPEVYSGGDRVFSRQVMTLEEARFMFLENAIVHHPARGNMNAIRKKLCRLGQGNATLNYAPEQIRQNVRFLLKNIIAFLLVPHQLRLAKATFSKYGYFKIFCWKFLFTACYFGWIQRGHLIVRFIQLMIGKKGILCKQACSSNHRNNV